MTEIKSIHFTEISFFHDPPEASIAASVNRCKIMNDGAKNKFMNTEVKNAPAKILNHNGCAIDGNIPASIIPSVPFENSENASTNNRPNNPQTKPRMRNPLRAKYRFVRIRSARSSPIDAKIAVFKNPIGYGAAMVAASNHPLLLGMAKNKAIAKAVSANNKSFFFIDFSSETFFSHYNIFPSFAEEPLSKSSHLKNIYIYIIYI